MNFLRYTQKDGVGQLEITRAEELNALNEALLEEMLSFLLRLWYAPPRCLVVTGCGERAFAAGADIDEMKDMTTLQAEAFSRLGNQVMTALEKFPCPVIAAVNGYALGGGFELALACDIRLAAENAVFSFPEVGLGIVPGFGGMQRAVRLLGMGIAKELVFTARRVRAKEALRLGLVNRVCPAGELRATAAAMAGSIVAQAPEAVRQAKQALNAIAGAGASRTARVEKEAFVLCFETADQRNAMAAFAEKRAPGPFLGR